MVFKDRAHAGQILAQVLFELHIENPLVLALARGGVPVGFEVAKKLKAPLQVFVSRKIGSPKNPEFGIGAVCEGGGLYLDTNTVDELKISERDLRGLIKKEKEEVERRVMLYRGHELSGIKGKDVILVDDGLATGVTARAAISSLAKLQPKRIIFAVPVCTKEVAAEFEGIIDEVICISRPVNFSSVGQWYEKFEQLEDFEVLEYLKEAKRNTIL